MVERLVADDGRDRGADDLLDAMAETIRALGEERFENAIASLMMAAAGCDRIAFVVFFAQGSPRFIYSNHSPAEELRIMAPYMESAYLLDPWYNMVIESAPDGAYLLSESAPDDFLINDYYTNYYSDLGLNCECAAFLTLSKGATLVASLARTTVGDVDLNGLRDFISCLRALCARHYRSLTNEPGESGSLDELCCNHGLSGREAEVTKLVLRGYSNKLIARELAISAETVKIYRKRVNRKLGTSSSREIFASFFPNVVPAGSDRAVTRAGDLSLHSG